jgi:hypothetical protein
MSAAPRKLGRAGALALSAVVLTLSLARPSFGQTTVGTGSIVGIAMQRLASEAVQ